MRYSWALPLLALPLASAIPDYRQPTVTSTKTVTKTATKTTTKTSTTTKVSTTTKTSTKTSTTTKTVSGKPITITAPASACPTTTTVKSTSASPSSSSASTTSASASTSSASSSATTTTTSSAVNTYPSSVATATATGTKGLNDYAVAAGKEYFGTAADIPGPEQQDAGYLAILDNKHEFGQVTPTNYMKYFATEPQRGVFDYTQGQLIIDIGAKNNQYVRCHNLIWHSQLPDWLTSQTWDNATLVSILENHIANVAGHWGDSCYHWDVVNEALNEDGTYRPSVWYDTIGPQFIPLAFAAAAKASPNSKLYYNDYNIEYPGPKSTAAQKIIAGIQAQGIKVNGAGLQAHFIGGSTPSLASQTANVQAFAALGVEVAYTELDVRVQVPASLASQQQQKVDYYNTVRACVNVPACVGVTLWDFLDQYSWIPGVFTGFGYADPWFRPENSTQIVKKSAYDGIVAALTGGSPV